MWISRRALPVALLAVLVCRLVFLPAARADEPTRSVDLGNGVAIELILVEPGEFTQGSPADEKNRGDDESPREVTITKPFYLGKSPVTRGQFARFVAATGFKTDAEKGTSGGFGYVNGELVQRPSFNWRNPGFPQTDDHPVVIVTWDDAQAFAKWLAGKARQPVRLPTEAEWEFALRAGTTTAFYSGDSDADADRIAWHKGNAGDGTRTVGGKDANAWGFVDLAGNVWEWCQDWYGPYPPGAASDPLETRSNLSDKPRRVLRGGSFLKDAKNCRSAARFRSTPGSRNADIGFRVAFHPVAAPEAASREVDQPAQTVEQPSATTPVETQRVPPRLQQFPPVQPPPAPPVATGLLAGLFCPCVLVAVGGAALVILFVVWRGQKRSAGDDFPPGVQPDAVSPATGSRSGPKPRRAPRIVADGFWLEDPAYAPGSIVRYSCLVGHTPTNGEFTVGPGHQGHFVYTGGTPSQVEILDVRPGSGPFPTDQPYDTLHPMSGPVILGSSIPHSSPPPRPPQHAHGSGFPPAY